MTDYLSYQFSDSPAFVDTYDELPLWSAPFGLLLLKHLTLKPNLVVIDIGCGTGFPLLELAGRLGKSCTLYGIDPWINAAQRVQQKIVNYGLTNVEIIAGSAEQIPFADQSVDLIVSNLGINNFDNPAIVFTECCRVLKPGGQLALTTNLEGHWKEFYHIFETTLRQHQKDGIAGKLRQQQAYRGTIASISSIFTGNGFNISRYVEDHFQMRFLDGTAFLHHHFIKLGWLKSWTDLIPREEWSGIFQSLEQNLNAYAREFDGLSLTVPMAFIEGEKPV